MEKLDRTTHYILNHRKRNMPNDWKRTRPHIHGIPEQQNVQTDPKNPTWDSLGTRSQQEKRPNTRIPILQKRKTSNGKTESAVDGFKNTKTRRKPHKNS
jgi:hypothetical protein